MAPSEWTCSVRAVRDTPVADYSAASRNRTRRVAYCPPIAVLSFRIALSVSDCERSPWGCTNISKKHFRPGGMAPSKWTHSVRAVRDTPVADYSAPGVHQQKTFPSRPNGSVRVDALRQSRLGHPSAGLLHARRQYHALHRISPSDRRFAVSSRSVGLLF